MKTKSWWREVKFNRPFALAASLLMASPLAAPSQSAMAPYVTSGALNCRGWHTLVSGSPDVAVFYLAGLEDGFLHGYVLGAKENVSPTESGETKGARLIAAIDNFFGQIARRTSHLNRSERGRALDILCAQPENAIVPIYDISHIVGMKSAGATAEELDTELANARKRAADLAASFQILAK